LSLCHLKTVCHSFYSLLKYSLLFISDLFEERPNAWVFCPKGSYLEYNGFTAIKDRKPCFHFRGDSDKIPFFNCKQLFHALKSRLNASGLCLKFNTLEGCTKKPCTYLHVCTKCFQPGHAKHACQKGFQDWGCIKVNGYPLSLFYDPAYCMDWKHFRHIKCGNPHNYPQLIFFKVLPQVGSLPESFWQYTALQLQRLVATTQMMKLSLKKML